MIDGKTVHLAQPYICGITYHDEWRRISTGVSLVVGVSEQDAQDQAIRVARDVLGDRMTLDTPVVDVMDKPLLLWNSTTQRWYRCTVNLELLTEDEAKDLRH